MIALVMVICAGASPELIVSCVRDVSFYPGEAACAEALDELPFAILPGVWIVEAECQDG